MEIASYATFGTIFLLDTLANSMHWVSKFYDNRYCPNTLVQDGDTFCEEDHLLCFVQEEPDLSRPSKFGGHSITRGSSIVYFHSTLSILI